MKGKTWEQYVFGANAECTEPHWRNWVKVSVAMVCTAAGLPRQTGHQMRGGARDLMLAARMDARAIDKHLGHVPGSKTGRQSYQGPAGNEAERGLVDEQVGARVLAFTGGKK